MNREIKNRKDYGNREQNLVFWVLVRGQPIVLVKDGMLGNHVFDEEIIWIVEMGIKGYVVEIFTSRMEKSCCRYLELIHQKLQTF